MKKEKDMNESRLEKAINMLRKLPDKNRETVLNMIEGFAALHDIKGETGIHFKPADGIGGWVTKMQSEMRSENTIKMYRYLAERFLKEHPEPTKAEVQAHFAKLLAAGKSRAFVDNIRKVLASLFRYLHEEGMVASNPMEGIKSLKVPYSQKEPPSEADIVNVMDIRHTRRKDGDKLRTVVVLLTTTGLRITEALSLRKDCIDYEAKQIKVIGKGNKPRVVPLLKQAVEVLSKYTKKYPSDSPFVFPGRTEAGHASIHNVEKTLKRACARAGVKPFTPHQLRHFYATHMLKSGAKLEVVSRILGHASVGITGDVYRYVSTDEMHQEADRYGPLNGGTE
jgi:integrase